MLRSSERKQPDATARLAFLSGRLWQHLRAAPGGEVTLNGHPPQRLPNTRNVSFLGLDGAVRLRVGRLTADREIDQAARVLADQEVLITHAHR